MKIKNITNDEIKNLRINNDYLVIQGCGGDLNEWVDGITELFKDEGIVNDSFSFDEVYTFQNGDLTNMIFSLNDVDISKLAIVRLNMRDVFGAMWLSDYIDNGYLMDINI